jgi:FMN phosphatase YigB (HAD superfamily)
VANVTPSTPIDLDTNACNYKALLLLDGNTASGRSSLWVHQGSVLLKPDSVFSEWYYHLLKPWVHYVPVREFLEDLEEQAEWVTNNATQAALSCLRENLEKLADEHVNREAIACYWWRLLTTWKKQQPEDSRTHGFQLVN